MSASRRFQLAVIAALLVAGGIASAAPPKVVSSTPQPGATEVTPGLSEIRVTFDQPMRQGWHSWVGGGDSFPEVVGTPQWRDERTAFLRVRLKPNHDYWLSVNNDRFKNFVSRSGEPAEPYPIPFKTGAADPNAAAGAAKLNELAAAELGKLIDERYSYRDHGRVDWSRLYPQAERLLSRTESPAEFAEQAAKVLGKARDLHIFLMCDGQRIASYVNPVTPNCNPTQLPKFVPNYHQHSDLVASGRFEDENIGYIRIDGWNAAQTDDTRAAIAALKDLSNCAGLIVDVRLNGGGDELLAREFAGCFVDKTTAYAKHVIREPDATGGFTPPQTRTFEPNTEGPKFRGKVAVLIGPAVVSSCEAFVLMMKQVDGCRLIGAPTRGSSGNPQPYTLSNGVKVYLPCWKAMTLDGDVFEGSGIKPDIAIRAGRSAFENADPVLERALRELQR